MTESAAFCADSARRTWDEAVAKWQRERGDRSAESIRRENALLRFAAPHLTGRALDTIRRADLESIRDAKLAAGASPRTANYLAQSITAILRAAVRWEWIARAPQLEALRNPPPREVFLSDEQASELLSSLPGHLSDLAEFCLETGLRQGNAKRLEWRQVDFGRNRVTLSAGEMKNRSPLMVPLTPRAAAMLLRLRGRHPRFVFTYKGRPIQQPTNTAWYAALERLGLAGVRFHDLRHTWASWHMEAGTDALILQKLGGWKTAQMVSRYTHLADSAAQAAVAQFGRRGR